MHFRKGIAFSTIIMCAFSAFSVEIAISGLKKTRESYLRQVLQKYADQTAQELDLTEVETTLQEQGLFSDIHTELVPSESGEPVLSITVAEKISFLPIPFASYSSNGFMGGLMVMDTNAFGVKDNYVLGGIFSRSMQMGISSFSKPSLSRTQPGFSVFASGAHRNNELTDSDENTVLEYTTVGGSAAFSVSDKITEHASVTLGIGYNYNHIALDDAYEQDYQDQMQTYHAFSVNGGWRLSLPELNDWFLSNKSASVGGGITFFSTGNKAPSVNAQISLQQPLPLTRLRLLAQVSGTYTKDNHIAMLPSQSAVGITIMPGKFHAAKMAGATIGLEVGLFKLSFATFSVYALYEYLLTEEWAGDTLTNQGYSAGAKMYLAKIAFPALAFGIAHNLSKNEVRFSAAFGVAF